MNDSINYLKQSEYFHFYRIIYDFLIIIGVQSDDITFQYISIFDYCYQYLFSSTSKTKINLVKMSIIQNVRTICSPIISKKNDMSFSRISKNISKSIWHSLVFIITFIYYATSKPQKLTLKMSKTAEKVSDIHIPECTRAKFFKAYSRYYGVKLDEIVDPIDSFQTFNAFFTRKVKPRNITQNPMMLVSPADSKILKISKIQKDQCSIIKGASYSLGELITGYPLQLKDHQINALKKNPLNNLYQVIFYLAPGDYHRFHSPANIYIDKKIQIDGILLSVNEKSLVKRKKVYEKNSRLVVEGKWSLDPQSNEDLYMNMIMVGALNVGRISVSANKSFAKGQELGYFNLGSTIVMLFEAKYVKKWYKVQGQKIRYGDILCEVIN